MSSIMAAYMGVVDCASVINAVPYAPAECVAMAASRIW